MKHGFVIFLSILLLFTACRKQPDGVLPADRMEDLLVDIHKTEAVMTLNHNKYPSDDKKRTMREAVFMRHNTSQEEFDYSLEWYGKNINIYMEIYDKVIERLKAENEAVKKLIAQDDAQILTQEGDTVDIWKQKRYQIFNAEKAENVLSFSINPDENFKRNDRFILRYHIVNAPHNGIKARAYMAIRHSEQNIHYNFDDVKSDGWNTLCVQSDSASNLNELYGYIAMPPRQDRHIMYIDSIELMRIHDKPETARYEYKVINATTSRHPRDIKSKNKHHKPTQETPALKKQEMKILQ